MVKLKSNRMREQSIAFPAVAGEAAFELQPGEERLITESHWRALQAVPSVALAFQHFEFSVA